MALFGDLAQKALEQAVQAYKAALVIETKMENLERCFRDFEGRVTGGQRDSDQRLREIERELASLRGKVDGGFAQALQLAIIQPAIERNRKDSDGASKLPPGDEDASG